ncbi:GNAT family N-acetyltransferase [Dongia soli]|uniref:GNAT family N-acetyltransferase n=1 Tax=Dongia soli TaxID=600628 RepID=A0ABU5ECP3_9PROT|nr:GNAT family N-acetyltransferase [Dongia soli]MDY0883819.1 GNAT family N-acetyltransferase [Dongia soli]
MPATADAIAIPQLETERLLLRGHQVKEFEDYAAIWGDPVVTRYIGGRPLTREECWARLLRHIGHWSVLGHGYWAIEEKASKRLIGELGFAQFKRDIQPVIEFPELGWLLSSAAHGKGYATEAVRAALAWGDEHFAGGTTACIIDPANRASLGVAAKCGYRELRQVTYKGHEITMLTR